MMHQESGPVDKSKTTHCVPCPTGDTCEIREISVMFWIYLDSKTPTKNDGKHSIIRKGDRQSGSVLPWIYLANNSNKIHVEITTKTNGMLSLVSTRPLQHKRWHHIGFTADATDMRLFIDSRMDKKQKTGSVLIGNKDPIYIGKPPQGVLYPFGNNDTKYYGFEGGLLDARFYLKRLSNNAFTQYFKRAVFDDKTNASTTITFTTNTMNPHTKSCLNMSYVSEACRNALPEFSADNNKWNPSHDSDIVELFELISKDTVKKILVTDYQIDPNAPELQQTVGVSQMDITPHSLNPKEYLEKFDSLNNIKLEALKRRYLMLRILNEKMKAIFPLVDFSQVSYYFFLNRKMQKINKKTYKK